MLTVALTGGIGSGKSVATTIFAELGVPITDLDVISHALTAAHQPILQEIQASFGVTYIHADGSLNRAAMRELVFNDAEARQKLNAILHPAIFAEAIKQLQLIQQNSHLAYQILAIPLLYDSPHYLAYIDRVLLIDCDEATQIARVKSRSNLSEAEILKIIHAQAPRKKLLELANDVIKNNSNIENLRKEIIKIHEKYINTCTLSKTIS